MCGKRLGQSAMMSGRPDIVDDPVAPDGLGQFVCADGGYRGFGGIWHRGAIEGEDVEPCSWCGSPGHRRDVAFPASDGHRMEQGTVDDRVEAPVVAVQCGDVGDGELSRRQATCARLAKGEIDSGGRQVDSHGAIAAASQVERQRGFTTPRVEDLADHQSGIDECCDFGLGFVQAPTGSALAKVGHRTAVYRIEVKNLCVSHSPVISVFRIYGKLIYMTNESALLGPLLYRVSAKLRAAMVTALRPFDLTLSEFVCLKLLRDTPGLSNADLARLFEVSPQTMNATLKALESSRLVQRPAAASQGRTLPTEITTAGRKLLDSIEPAARNAEATVLAALPAADRRRFRAMLQAVAG